MCWERGAEGRRIRAERLGVDFDRLTIARPGAIGVAKGVFEVGEVGQHLGLTMLAHALLQGAQLQLEHSQIRMGLGVDLGLQH